MSTPVEIVISALDRFSPVFNRLDEAFRQSGASGGQAQTAMAGLGDSFIAAADKVGKAESAITAFLGETDEGLTALAEERQAQLESLGAQHEEFAQRLGERLTALDEQAATRREGLWRQSSTRQQQQLAAHHDAMIAAEGQFQARISAIEQAGMESRLENFRQFTLAIHDLAASQGRSLAQVTKALAIAEALISAYLAGSKALASVPFPFNFAAAAAVTAQGLAAVERIRQVNIAHGGLENIPEDATFLLRRGERVLSPDQNRELTQFIEQTREQERSGSVEIEHLTIHILENATSGDALLRMERDELRLVISERIIPMLDELARLGVRPQFVDNNL